MNPRQNIQHQMSSGHSEKKQKRPRKIAKRENSKKSPYSITERRVLELIPVLGSQPAGDVSSKPDGRLPLISAMGTLGTCQGPPDFFSF